jgi:hypothetical protein
LCCPVDDDSHLTELADFDVPTDNDAGESGGFVAERYGHAGGVLERSLLTRPALELAELVRSGDVSASHERRAVTALLPFGSGE